MAPDRTEALVDVLIILVFVSLVLVAAAILFLFSRVHGGDLDHGDRLSLMPLDDDANPSHKQKEGETVPR